MNTLKFMAIKVHYDHRPDLPHYLKYSRLPTEEEYQQFIDLYQDGIGGEGFHEGLNFHAELDEVQFYVPPTCIPSRNNIEDDFIIFSFSYKADKEVPNSILGVHAGAKFLDKIGIRENSISLKNIGNFTYHAISPTSLTTIFTTPIRYNLNDNKYLPFLRQWGNGNRYLDKKHALNILSTAYNNVKQKLELNQNINLVEREVALNEKAVIERIFLRYFKREVREGNFDFDSNTDNCGYNKPDKELGFRGELLVYKLEVNYMRYNNLPIKLVEWLSQSRPNTVFDIKTVRLINGKPVVHFLEVKSSSLNYGENVYLSSKQIEFFEKHKEHSNIVFVNYHNELPQITYKKYDELLKEFLLTPIKFKLKLK